MGDKKWILGLVSLVVLIGMIVWGATISRKNNPVSQVEGQSTNSSTTANYFAEDASVLYFYSDTCHYCILQKEVLAKLGQEGYRVKPMDVGKNPNYWKEYNIEGTPTFIADKGKGERQVGYLEYQPLKNWLDSHK